RVRPAASPRISRPRMDPRPVLLGIALSDYEIHVVRKPLWIRLVIPRQRELVVIPVRRPDLKYRARGRRRLVLGRSGASPAKANQPEEDQPFHASPVFVPVMPTFRKPEFAGIRVDGPQSGSRGPSIPAVPGF